MKPRVTVEDLDNWFTYHPPTGETQIAAYTALRTEARRFAGVIYTLCPDGPDRTAAIRKVREAVMTANAGIACAGEPEAADGTDEAPGRSRTEP